MDATVIRFLGYFVVLLAIIEPLGMQEALGCFSEIAFMLEYDKKEAK